MLTEWHLSPDYILGNWTDELLGLMIDKLVERKEREAGIVHDKSSNLNQSEEELFMKASHLIKHNKLGDEL